MTRRTLHTRDFGFTLIEVVTVLAILAVVSTMGTLALFRVDQQWRAAYARTELNAAAGIIFDRIRADVDSLLSPLRTGAVIDGEDATYSETDDSNLYWRQTFADDQCTLPVEEFDTARRIPVRERVTYRVARDGNVPVLVRETQPLNATEETEETEAPAAPPVTTSDTGALEFNVEYLREGQWQETWNGPGAPAALRISVTLMNVRRPFEQVARKTIIPVHVD